MAEATHIKFRFGDHVEDVVSHRRGRIVYIYTNPGIAYELVAVQFEDCAVPITCHVDDLQLVRS